ncbi:MAG: DinB family protein [Maribacter sp.]
MNIKIKASIGIIVFLIFNLASSQQKVLPKTDFTKMYLPVWEEATKHCMEVAKAMPEELYAYKPTDVSKSFAEQMVHIGYTVELLTKRYVEGLEVKPYTPDASKMTKAEIIILLEKGFNYTENVVRTIEQEKLNESCTMYHSGNTVSRSFAFFYVQDHMTNHRAKANLYLRMNGINPPEYTW